MPNTYTSLSSLFTAIANAIRSKLGTSAPIVADDFPTQIGNISTGTDVSDTTATAADVLSGKAFYLANGTKTQGSIASKAAQTYTPTTTDQTIAAGQYLSGAQTVKGDANLVAGNIKKDVTIFGVTGSHEGGGTDVSDTTAVASDVLQGKTFYLANGTKTTGTYEGGSGPQPTLHAPLISISGLVMTITNPATNGDYVTAYKVFIDGALHDTIQTTTYDFTSEITAAGTYAITVTAIGTNFTESASSNSLSVTVDPAPANTYVTFSSPTAFSVFVNNGGTKKWNGTIYASTDKNTWAEWTGASINSAESNGAHYIYMRGENASQLGGGNYGVYGWTFNGSNISISGDAENLIDWETAAQAIHPNVAPSCFASWLTPSSSDYAGSITDVSHLILPRKISQNAYARMLKGCTGIVAPPVMPTATSLADECYRSMFSGCRSLTSAPALPTTTLANACYIEMFSGCTSLASAPELPATTLANYCYNNMFNGCTSLASAPELPATTLANNCYSYMFKECTSLTSAPALPATTLADYCYSNMFKECTSLTSAPALPATTLAEGCYGSMFIYCSNLVRLPELPATSLASGCYSGMLRSSGAKIVGSSSGDYVYEFRIPSSGTIEDLPSNWNLNMSYGTGGVNPPSANTTYYTNHPLVPASS